MPMLVDALLLCVLLVSWGAQATVPWRLAGAAGQSVGPGAAPAHHRRLWRFAALALVVTGLVAALALADRNPDATIAGHLVPLLSSTPGRLLALLASALLASALIAGLAGERLDANGLRLVAAIGLAACAAMAWAGELVRAGDGPASQLLPFALLAGCRLALTLAAGELLSPGRPLVAVAGGMALAAYLPLLPRELRGPLWGQGLQLTCAAAALLLLAARWLPRPLRRLALAMGLLLAAILLAQAGRVSQALAPGVEIEQDLPAIR
jgi:hypothetical protein